jgi:KaiC/GvpD/RAD55 family RecA-like ATPase
MATYQTLKQINADVSKIPQKLFTTTFPRIDEITDGGFTSSSINIVVADSGLGKTSYLCQIALELARQGKKVHFC